MKDLDNCAHSVFIDASIFVKGEAFARLSGTVRLQIVPEKGDALIFNTDKSDILENSNTLLLFSPLVDSRSISVNDETQAVMISLADINFENVETAVKTLKLIEKAYGLSVDVYGSENGGLD